MPARPTALTTRRRLTVVLLTIAALVAALATPSHRAVASPSATTAGRVS